MRCVVTAEFGGNEIIIALDSVTACKGLIEPLADSRVATLPPDRRAFPGEFGRPDFALDVVRLRAPNFKSDQNDDWL